MTALFISHSSRDDAVSRLIIAALRDQGFTALFLDIDPEVGIAAGRNWEKELYAQLRKADGVVFLGSPAALASHWCHTEVALARAFGKPVFPVLVEPSKRHPLLTDVQWADATHDGPAGARQLCDALRQAGLDPRDSFAWDPARSPYPGLAPFEEQDAAVFFGRADEIKDLLEALRPTSQRDRGRFLMVVGPSGSGKSSLVRAGLIPRLRRSGHRWVVLPPMMPGDRPTVNLARCLKSAFASRDVSTSLAHVQQQLEAGAAGLVDVLQDVCAATETTPARTLLVVDQAEELVTRCPETERDRFLALLRGALSPDSPLWVVATVRSEFLSRLITDADIANIVDEPYVVGPVLRRQLPQVIARPARRAGVEFAPGLIERMVDDAAGGDALPLLAFTLSQLYENGESGTELTTQDYEAVGAVVGALTRQADSVLADLTARGLGDVVLPALLRLAAVEDGEPVRRRVPLRSFTDDARTVLDAFVDARLLTTGGLDGDAAVAVAHEALLRRWTPLRDAIAEARESLELRADIERSARAWDAAGRDDSYLLRGVRLARVSETDHHVVKDFRAVERAYIAASKALAARENRRLRRLVTGLAILLCAALVAAGIAAAQTDVARRQAIVARSRQLAAQANARFRQRPYLGLLIALEGARTAPTREALSALATGLGRSLHPKYEPLTGHTDWVRDVAFSPDGATIASTSDDETVRLWDVAGRRQVGVLTAHIGWVRTVAFSPDGTVLASAGDGELVRLWDVASRRPIGPPLRGHAGSVRAVAFSPDGTVLASASDDETVRLWDVAGRRQVGAPLRGHEGSVRAVAFSSDGVLASAGDDLTVRLWDVARGKPLGEPLAGHRRPVWAVAFSPDGTVLASASEDRTVRLWDTTGSPPVATTLRGHDSAVRAVAFSPDGGMLASAGDDLTVRLWDAVGGRPVGEPLTGHRKTVRAVAFSPDGALLASGSGDATVRLWGAVARRPLGEPLTDHAGSVLAVAFSPDGGVLASAGEDRSVRLWDVAGRRQVDELLGHTDWVNALAFSPDGATVASAGLNRELRVWDLAGRGPTRTPLSGHGGSVRAVAFSPAGGVLASAGDDRLVRLWDVAGRRQVGAPLRGHGGSVRAVAFSPDGGVLASGGGDGTVRLWNVASRRPIGPLRGHEGSVRAVAFGPDGRMLASAGDDETVRLWDVAGRRQVGAPLRGHGGSVRAVAFSPDGGVLASGGGDGTVRLWDVAGRRQVGAPLRGHEGSVRAVAFSPDGGLLASAGDDENVRLWATPRRWVDEACGIAGRNLSRQEWNTWIGAAERYIRACPRLPAGRGAPAGAAAAEYGPPLVTTRR